MWCDFLAGSFEVLDALFYFRFFCHFRIVSWLMMTFATLMHAIFLSPPCFVQVPRSKHAVSCHDTVFPSMHAIRPNNTTSRMHLITNRAPSRMHFVTIVNHIACSSPSKLTHPLCSPSAASRAAATRTQSNHHIVHIVNTCRAARGNAAPARRAHDNFPGGIQQLEQLRPGLHSCRRSKIQPWIDVHG